MIISCGSKNGDKKSDFSLNISGNKTEFKQNDTLKVEVINKESKAIDSIRFFLGDTYLKSQQKAEPINFDFSKVLLGNQVFKAIVYTLETTDTLQKSLKIMNQNAPKVYTYEIINTYPHNTESYTQGLEFYNDTLYESTGQYGRSKLIKVDLETGKALNEIKLDNEYFAEGITILNDKIYQLTWQEDEGFIYNLNTFEKLGSFAYNQSKEGWGLCNNGNKIFKSDGTEKIWILDPVTLAEKSYIQPTTNTSIKSKFNELEWVDGMIYANTYQFPSVAMINPETGGIEGIINFKGLTDQLGNKDDLDPQNDVLNGIAYNPITKKLYVTGKKWDTLFEVKILER
ncbi:glutaminyl-peptide cyclotransferase [Christiangramia aquimixticola]|uniref:glutaminyl-peptide cyclotransferase n=1 Tax=Christiangramia aquimixticola TaxID=1697558 RepID=UPI003AA96BA2